MNITRALIVRREHLDNIFDNGKIWEMRSTKTNVRGRIGLIEAGSGLIVGETFLVDCLDPLKYRADGRFVTDNKTEGDTFGQYLAKVEHTYPLHQVKDLDLLNKWNTPWVLEGSFRYKFPISYKHPAGAVIWVKL